MKLESGRYDDLLMTLRRRFVAAAVVLFVMAMVCVYLERTGRQLDKTHKELLRAEAGLSRVKQAAASHRQTLAALKAQFERLDTKSSTARVVYGRVDEIQASYKPDEMSIGSLEKKGNDVSLSYIMKFVDIDYSRFLTIVHELQRGVFPVSQVTSILIGQAPLEGKGSVTFTIHGAITSIEKSQP